MAQSKRKNTPNRSRQINSIQIMFAAILAIGLILTINFSSRITESRSSQEVYARVQNEIDALREEQAELTALRDYVLSDAYVEAWANADGKMVRPGEVLVVPVPSGASVEVTPQAPTTFAEIQTLPEETESWELWWALFFDDAPPDLR